MNEQIQSIKSIKVESWLAAQSGMPESANPHQEGTSAHQVWDAHHKQVLKRPITDRAEA